MLTVTLSEDQINDMVERSCRFNGDAESSCDCGAHKMRTRLLMALRTDAPNALSETACEVVRGPLAATEAGTVPAKPLGERLRDFAATLKEGTGDPLPDPDIHLVRSSGETMSVRRLCDDMVNWIVRNSGQASFTESVRGDVIAAEFYSLTRRSSAKVPKACPERRADGGSGGSYA